MNILNRTIWFKALVKSLGVCLLILMFSLLMSGSAYAITYGTYTFDADNDADEDAWTFISDNGGTDGLNPSDTRREWSWDSNDSPSGSVGPTSGQGGNPDGYVYTEASSPGAFGDTYHMTLDQILDASATDWSVNFYTNQRGII